MTALEIGIRRIIVINRLVTRGVDLPLNARQGKGDPMSFWIAVGIVAVYLLLQIYILPRLGIST